MYSQNMLKTNTNYKTICQSIGRLCITNKHNLRDFLENQVFLAKRAKNLVTKPAGENPLAALYFQTSFLKFVKT